MSEPASPGGPPVIRPPRLDHEASSSPLSAAMVGGTGFLSGEGTYKGTVRVRLGVDGKLTNCRLKEAKIYRALLPMTDVTAHETSKLCAVVVRNIVLNHALALDGRAVESFVDIVVELARYSEESRRQFPPMPRFASPTTSGRALDANGRIVRYDSEYYSVTPPDWTAIIGPSKKLLNRSRMKIARVGVMLRLDQTYQMKSVRDCTVEVSSGSPLIDEATCQALRTASYMYRWESERDDSHDYPAIVSWDRSGIVLRGGTPEPPHMPADATLSVSDHPTKDSAPIEPVSLTLRLDENGRADACQVDETSGSDPWDAASCRAALAKTRFTPALDFFGRPVRGEYDAVADWQAGIIKPAR